MTKSYKLLKLMSVHNGMDILKNSSNDLMLSPLSDYRASKIADAPSLVKNDEEKYPKMMNSNNSSVDHDSRYLYNLGYLGSD